MKNNSVKTEKILVNYIKDNCLPKNSLFEVGNNMDLFDAGIVDSAGLISFLAFIEAEFDISIPDDELLPENFSSINKICNYIQSKQRVANVI